MKLGSVRYLVGEGFKNTWVNRLMTLASVGVLVACMVVIGLAVLISENVTLALGRLEQQNVVMVYMKDYNWALYGTKDESADTASQDENTETGEEADANGIKSSDYVIHDEQQAQALCDAIKALPNVADVAFVSSEAGLAEAKETMLSGQADYFTFLDDEYGNPLSCAAKVTMVDMEQFNATLSEIQAIDGVDTIVSQGDLAEKITAMKKGLAVAGFWIIVILLIISLVIVSNTIRVTMYTRKLEISIMKAVGATNPFIRIPFIVEGMVIGTVSAVLSELLLYFCYRVATETIMQTLNTTEIVRYGDIMWQLLALFLIIGMVAGVLGSFIIIGKYLRKEGSEFSAI